MTMTKFLLYLLELIHIYRTRFIGGLNSPEPVVGRGNRGHGHTQADWRNLGTVQKVGAEESNGHEGVEEVDEDTGGDLGRLVLGTHGGADGQGDHADAHAAPGDHEDGAASEAVDGEEGDEGRQELPGQRAASKGAGVLGGHAKVGLENDGCIHRDEVGTPEVVKVSKESRYTEQVDRGLERRILTTSAGRIAAACKDRTGKAACPLP